MYRKNVFLIDVSCGQQEYSIKKQIFLFRLFSLTAICNFDIMIIQYYVYCHYFPALLEKTDTFANRGIT